VKSRDKYLHAQCLKLAGILVLFLPEDQREKFQCESLMELFKDAAELAYQIRLSPQLYDFVTPFRCSDSNRDRVLFDEDKVKYKIINAANCQPLRDSDIIETGLNGRIGKKLCVIHPALVRNGGTKRDDTTLTKATILATLDHPICRPQNNHAAPKMEGTGKPQETENKEDGGGWFKRWSF
jgi:hypothetical protein